jgi:hypothetical protein
MRSVMFYALPLFANSLLSLTAHKASVSSCGGSLNGLRNVPEQLGDDDVGQWACYTAISRSSRHIIFRL